jgi:hypothetical protein
MQQRKPREKRDVKYYVKPKELFLEIKKSQEIGELTPQAVQMLMKMCRRTIGKLSYKYPDDIDDGVSTAQEKILRYWKNFDESITTNAFAFFTSIIKNAYAESFKKMRGNMTQSSIISLSDDFSGLF